MVYYSIDTKARTPVYFFLASISIVLAYLLSFANTPLKTFLAPDVMLIYGILVWLFDVYLWKMKLVQSMIKMPNLDGTYKGKLTRQNDGKSELQERDITLTVSQTWLTMSLVFEGERSQSTAKMILMSVQDPKHIVLNWIYDCKDYTGLEDENLYGEGTTELKLRLSNGKRKLQGHYYSSKLRHGHLDLEQIS